ncbi:hypothetical protein MSG28_008073 [Choristoneura fumiferana]|uniref:Uncharacterized protein n=1 Tax=Choristoneura fumiferana TaxID=7141 RepID=A0ACC0J9T9_CHOFU|nr:hypothetical protein MSG28_008073 [Choristoneura fumiferana]
MLRIVSFISLLATLISGIHAKSVELTFELPDNAVECFYEQIENNTSASLEYQVITGGQYDVDVKVEGPNKQIIYQQQKMQYDSHPFTATQTGIYKVCFSNEFSTFSHKLVYMELNVGPEQPLPGVGEHATVLTQSTNKAKTPLTNAQGYAISGLCSASPDIVTKSRLADRADHITATADRERPIVPSKERNIPSVASTTMGSMQ